MSGVEKVQRQRLVRRSAFFQEWLVFLHLHSAIPLAVTVFGGVEMVKDGSIRQSATD
jgi:hypothetical protein